MKPLSKLLALILFVTASAFSGTDQMTISGTVTEASGKKALQGVSVSVKGTKINTVTDAKGWYEIKTAAGKQVLVFSNPAYSPKEITVSRSGIVNVGLDRVKSVAETVKQKLIQLQRSASAAPMLTEVLVTPISGGHYQYRSEEQGHNTESYNAINENRFLEARQNPLSTFGIDVDAASYSNIRRFINNGQLPPVDAVRIEEMINYFDYDYPQPQKNDPVSINTEISAAPWNKDHRLVKIGLQGKTIPTENLPASNLVFLIDVSGSMDMPNRLPLVKSSMMLLVDQLRPKDRVAIVVYASATGLVLKSTSGEEKRAIKDSINKLEAGGSTAGGAGIKLAYQVAADNFIKGGNNRVILATDGDFNVGVSSDAEMQRLIEQKWESGISLTVLGYGMGNYKDSKMETLADKGNGNYAYIDNISEAKKTLVNEFGGTLFTIASDVKLQVEFNPAKVQAYRLIGYENRLLNKEDFNNDKKDAGDLGSGHTVTAMYEVIPAGIKSSFVEKVDDLKYQKVPAIKSSSSEELLNIKLRYKTPGETTSKLQEQAVPDRQISWANSSDNFRFAAAVAGYGMMLRNSEFKQSTNYPAIIEWAEGARGKDKEGYRAEFIRMVKSSGLMAKDLLSVNDK